jgi:acetyl esterase/lipase
LLLCLLPVCAAVAGFEYRLMPKHRFGDILDDAMTMFTHLRDILGYQPSKIVLAGDSAGGHLALSLALHLRQQGFEVNDVIHGTRQRVAAFRHA